MGCWRGPGYEGRRGVDPGGYEGTAAFSALGALARVGLLVFGFCQWDSLYLQV